MKYIIITASRLTIESNVERLSDSLVHSNLNSHYREITWSNRKTNDYTITIIIIIIIIML